MDIISSSPNKANSTATAMWR